jgi:hypothetical protein
MEQGFRVLRQIGVDDEVEVGQVEPARGDIGCDTDIGAVIAQRLQRVCALFLAEFAREGDDREATISEAALKMRWRRRDSAAR